MVEVIIVDNIEQISRTEYILIQKMKELNCAVLVLNEQKEIRKETSSLYTAILPQEGCCYIESLEEPEPTKREIKESISKIANNAYIDLHIDYG